MSFDLRRAPSYERLTLNHPKAGAGERGFLVLRQGYKAVLLLYPPTLRAFNIDRDDYRRARPTPYPVPPARLARRLRQKRAQFRRLGVPFSAAAVRAALLALDALPDPSNSQSTPAFGRIGKRIEALEAAP